MSDVTMTSSDDLSPRPTNHNLRDETIAGAIAAATRGIHSRLNKSILSCLPLALPPRASDPSAYVTGLLHIAPIYIKFEEIWHDFLHAPTKDATDGQAESVTAACPDISSPCTPPPPPQTHGQALSAREQSILHALHLPKLARGDRLKADVQCLTGWAEHVVESQLQVASQSPHLAAMLRHMETSLAEKPLLLVTYMYIMYMALFAGGRFIRATLESTEKEFWQAPLAPIKPTMQPCVSSPTPSMLGSEDVEPKLHNGSHKCNPLPLSFFHFDTPEDGEDLKIEFKRRLHICEEALEPHEADSIIQEATSIFEHMTNLVNQLETICEDDCSENESATVGDYVQAMPILGRLRDSMAVAKERRARNSSRASSSGDNSADTVIRRRRNHSIASNESRMAESVVPEHPPLPAITGVELCPVPAADPVHFNSSFDLGEKGRAKSLTGGREKSKPADVTSCILAALLGIVVMGVVVVLRRGLL